MVRLGTSECVWVGFLVFRPNRRRLSFLLKHPAILFDLPRRDAHSRIASKAITLGLTDAKRVDVSEFLDEPVSLPMIKTMIKVAKKNVPYHDCAFLYYLVRALKPRVTIETGVWYGYSSAFILQALDEIGAGTLCSVDLRDLSFPKSLEVGFAVPEKLRSRWTLILGPSKSRLPEVLVTYPQVDLFIHDSDHSYETMMLEFQTAWPSLRPGGVLVSDNVEMNRAFDDFCSKVDRARIKARTLTSTHGVVIKENAPLETTTLAS